MSSPGSATDRETGVPGIDVLHVAPVLLSLRFRGSRPAVIVALICTLFIVAGHFLSSPGTEGWTAVFNRAIATVAVGALWEVLEFGMDHVFGTTLQKPMAGDASGLTDTMWDLIVDSLGALTISVLGWWYMVRERQSFIEVLIRRFIERNPWLFRA